MLRLLTVGFAVLGLCRPALAFDFAPKDFGERYNEIASTWDYVDRVYPSACLVPARAILCYRFGPGAGVVITPAEDGSQTKTIEYFFAMGGPQIGGLKFAPWVTVRMLFPTMSYEARAEMLAAVGPDRLRDIGGGQSLVRQNGVAVLGEFFPQNRVWHLKFDDERLSIPNP